MKANDLARILVSLPSPTDLNVYFKIPETDYCCPGDKVLVTNLEYDSASREVVLGCRVDSQYDKT